MAGPFGCVLVEELHFFPPIKQNLELFYMRKVCVEMNPNGYPPTKWAKALTVGGRLS